MLSQPAVHKRSRTSPRLEDVAANKKTNKPTTAASTRISCILVACPFRFRNQSLDAGRARLRSSGCATAVLLSRRECDPGIALKLDSFNPSTAIERALSPKKGGLISLVIWSCESLYDPRTTRPTFCV